MFSFRWDNLTDSRSFYAGIHAECNKRASENEILKAQDFRLLGKYECNKIPQALVLFKKCVEIGPGSDEWLEPESFSPNGRGKSSSKEASCRAPKKEANHLTKPSFSDSNC